MNIRELIEELESIAELSGDDLYVKVNKKEIVSVDFVAEEATVYLESL